MPARLKSTLSAAEICRFAEIDLAPDDLSAGQFLDRLLSEERYNEAIRFMAHALEEEAVIRWACACVKQLSQNETEERRAALRVTEEWLGGHEDGKRRAAKESAEKSKLNTAAGALAMAVFFSGGSIAPPSAPDVPPPPQICQKISAVAVTLAVVSDHPENAPQRFQQAIELGRG